MVDEIPEDTQIEQPPTLDLAGPGLSDEMHLTFTTGQTLFLYQLVEQAATPRGSKMVAFVNDLFERFGDIDLMLQTAFASQFGESPNVDVELEVKE